MIKNLERLNSWLISRKKKNMARTFNEADEEFQELMETINKKIIGLNSVAISDNDAEKYKEIERKDELKELAKKIITTDTLEPKETENKDNIKSPTHYVSGSGIEVFEVQEAFIHELKGMAASYWCNVVKYILRFQRKNGVEDLKKAKYYLEKLIEEVEK